nr:immunoglobulin light chain junction region [Mus musculus]
CQNGHSFPRTF